jgi:hypothetical protein
MGLHILKSLHNSFIVYSIKFYFLFSMKVIKQSREDQKLDLGESD